jgi:hypothetical protein
MPLVLKLPSTRHRECSGAAHHLIVEVIQLSPSLLLPKHLSCICSDGSRYSRVSFDEAKLNSLLSARAWCSGCEMQILSTRSPYLCMLRGRIDYGQLLWRAWGGMDAQLDLNHQSRCPHCPRVTTWALPSTSSSTPQHPRPPHPRPQHWEAALARTEADSI